MRWPRPFIDFKKEGKIREFGVSNFTNSQVALLEKSIPVKANQVEFSLSANKVMYDGTFDDCIIHNRMAMAWSPLGGYFRENGQKRERIEKVMKELEEKYKANASQLLLAWILKHPAEVYPVVGTTNEDRLNESVLALDIVLETEDWFSLLTASEGHEVP